VKVQITKKLIMLNKSKAIIIPQEWLEDQERLTGKPVKEVVMNINGIITISVAKKANK
jgi:hypothetical protein